MALTLLDMQRLKKDDYDIQVYDVFQWECDLTRKLKFTTLGTTEIRGRRTNSIPTVGFRSRGQMFGQVNGVTYDEVSDAIYPLGATIDIDKTDLRDKAVTMDPLTERTQYAVKGMAWTFNDYAVNGDHGTDPDGFEGVKVRLANAPAAQTIYGNSSSTALAVGTAIANNTTATMQTFLDKIDEAIETCDGGTADVCLTGADFIRALKASLRRLNLYKDVDPSSPYVTGLNQRRTSATPDLKPVFSWNGVEFYNMGLKADQSTQIVGNDTIGGNGCRPAYFLKLNEPYLHGIQQYAMEITKPTMLDDQVTFRTSVDWPVGLRHVHPAFGVVLKGCDVVA